MKHKKFIFALCLLGIAGGAIGLMRTGLFKHDTHLFVLINILSLIVGLGLIDNPIPGLPLNRNQRFVWAIMSWLFGMVAVMLFFFIAAKLGWRENWGAWLPFFIERNY